jgi:hypothetical protein
MNATIIDYWQSEDYISAYLGTPAVRKSLPGEARTDQLVLRKLGFRGLTRLRQFQTEYQGGWGEGEGKPLSPKAVRVLFHFLEASNFADSIVPSIFLSKAGSIGLSWEDRKGNSIEVTISGNLIDYFTERDGREESVTVDRVQELADTLSSL